MKVVSRTLLDKIIRKLTGRGTRYYKRRDKLTALNVIHIIGEKVESRHFNLNLEPHELFNNAVELLESNGWNIDWNTPPHIYKWHGITICTLTP